MRTLAATLLLLCVPGLLHADTAAEMLEKGIYNEETVGNLDEAIKIYREVLSVAGETERLAAKAQYRLGSCLLKQAKHTEAKNAFRQLIEKYPDQKQLVAKARKHLPAKLTLGKAPWKSGERLTMVMKLPGGQSIGLVGTAVDSAKMDGKPVWNMAVRRFVAAGLNEGISHIRVDAKTNRPLLTRWDHTVLGKANATWKEETIEVALTKGKETEKKTVGVDGPVYSNDQCFFALRQLPLEVGYEVTIPIRVAFTGGTALGFEVKVEKKEKIKTDVGEFDCFRLETNIGQTFWVADVPQRYIVRFQAEGVVATLTSIVHGDKPARVENKSLGFAFTVPKGWFHMSGNSTNAKTSAGYQLVSPGRSSASLRIRDKALLDRDERASLEAWKADRVASGKRKVAGLTLREGSEGKLQVSGAEGLRFGIDAQVGGQAISQTAILAFTDDLAIAINGHGPRSAQAASQRAAEDLAKSLTIN